MIAVHDVVPEQELELFHCVLDVPCLELAEVGHANPCAMALREDGHVGQAVRRDQRDERLPGRALRQDRKVDVLHCLLARRANGGNSCSPDDRGRDGRDSVKLEARGVQVLLQVVLAGLAHGVDVEVALDHDVRRHHELAVAAPLTNHTGAVPAERTLRGREDAAEARGADLA